VARTWLAGCLSLFAALLIHEIVAFGYFRGFLTGEREMVSYFYPSGVGEIVAVNALTAAVMALPLALIAWFKTNIRPLIVPLGITWLALCLWGYFSTASGYRAHFGTTWLPHEPFLELMWSPVLTPLSTLIGIGPFMWAIRRP